MPTYVPPKKNTQFIFYSALVQQASTLLLKSSPTLASGDFKTSLDGAALGNLGTLPTVTPSSSVMVKYTLSTGEMNGDNTTVVSIDAAGAEWCDKVDNFQTAARQIEDLAYPATSGRSMVVDASGLVDANTVKLGPTGSGTAQTARDLGLAIPAAVAGAAGGLFIAGTNAPVTITGSGDALTLTSTGANGSGVNASGNGSGSGIKTTAGATGFGVLATGGATSGDGIRAIASGGGDGLRATGIGSGNGIIATAGATGIGILGTGGATSGDGIRGIAPTSGDGIRGASSTQGNGIQATGGGSGNGIIGIGGATGVGVLARGGATSGAAARFDSTSGDGLQIIPTAGHAINATANGTSKHGIVATGGGAGTSDGIKGVAGTGGVDIRGNITGDVTGNLSGSAGSVTGAVGSVAAGGIIAASFGVDAIDAAALKADAVTEIVTGVFAKAFGSAYQSKTFQELIQAIVAAVIGVTSGAGTPSEVFKSPDGGTTVVTVTNDGTNRTASTIA